MSPFRRLWLAQAVSLLGDFVAVFAVQVAVVFRMHGSSTDMAGVFIASLLPGAILGPLAGAWVDRSHPRRVMIASDLLRAVAVLGLMFTNHLTQIYVISFAISCASSFFSPAQSIAIPLLVPHEKLFAAAAQMQQAMQVTRIASPVIAAALIGAFNERACYGVDAASFVFSAMMIASLQLPPSLARNQHPVAADLTAGFRFIFSDTCFLFVTLGMTTATFAVGCFASLASLYVRDVLRTAVSAFGIMGSLIGVGTIAGSALIPRVAKNFDPTTCICAGMAGVGVSILMLAAFPLRVIAFAGSFGIGFAAAFVLAGCAVMVQGKSPVEMRGRVSGATAGLASFAQLAAMIFAGAWAKWLGVQGVFVLSATLLLLVSAGAAWWQRQKSVSLPESERSDLRQAEGALLREDAA